MAGKHNSCDDTDCGGPETGVHETHVVSVCCQRMCVCVCCTARGCVWGQLEVRRHTWHISSIWSAPHFLCQTKPWLTPINYGPLRTDTAILPESLRMPKSGKLPGSKARVFPRGRILCQGLMDIQGWTRPHIRFRLNWPFATSYTVRADPVTNSALWN